MSLKSKQKEERNNPLIYIVSDGRGETANKMLNSALTQFKCKHPSIKICADVRTPNKAKNVVNQAQKKGGVIFYTLVQTDIRKFMKEEAQRVSVPLVDLLGSSLSALHKVLKCRPSEIPGLSQELEEERSKRMKAIDYTLDHDDSKDLKGLKHADIVLVGVSRSSKTSTAFYLGYCGIKVANIPIHYNSDLPQELHSVDKKKIVALTIAPYKLKSARITRAEYYNFDIDNPYTSDIEIAKELRYLNNLIEKFKWKHVDVTTNAIEEIAWEIRQIVGINIAEFPTLI